MNKILKKSLWYVCAILVATMVMTTAVKTGSLKYDAASIPDDEHWGMFRQKVEQRAEGENPRIYGLASDKEFCYRMNEYNEPEEIRDCKCPCRMHDRNSTGMWCKRCEHWVKIRELVDAEKK